MRPLRKNVKRLNTFQMEFLFILMSSISESFVNKESNSQGMLDLNRMKLHNLSMPG